MHSDRSEPKKKTSRISNAKTAVKQVGATAITFLTRKDKKRKISEEKQNQENVSSRDKSQPLNNSSSHSDEWTVDCQSEDPLTQEELLYRLQLAVQGQKKEAAPIEQPHLSPPPPSDAVYFIPPPSDAVFFVPPPTDAVFFGPPPSYFPPPFIALSQQTMTTTSITNTEPSHSANELPKAPVINITKPSSSSSTNELYEAIAKRRKQLNEAKKAEEKTLTAGTTTTTQTVNTATHITKSLNISSLPAVNNSSNKTTATSAPSSISNTPTSQAAAREKLVQLDQSMTEKQEFKTIVLEETYEEIKEEISTPIKKTSTSAHPPKKPSAKPHPSPHKAQKQPQPPVSKNRSSLFCCCGTDDSNEDSQVLIDQNPSINKKHEGRRLKK